MIRVTLFLITNLAVMLAALGVFGTGSAWPDLVVAAVMAGLAITAGHSVLQQARGELVRLRDAPEPRQSSGELA